MSSNGTLGVRRSDLLQVIEEMLSSKLGKARPELTRYAINNNAQVAAKLYNISQFTNYNFDYVAEAVQNLGNAQAVQNLDITSQLLLAIDKEGLKLLKEQQDKSTDAKKDSKPKTINNPEDLDISQDEQEIEQ